MRRTWDLPRRPCVRTRSLQRTSVCLLKLLIRPKERAASLRLDPKLPRTGPGYRDISECSQLRLASTSEETATKSKRPMQGPESLLEQQGSLLCEGRTSREVELDLQLSSCPLCQLGRKDCTEERSRVRPACCRQNPRLVLGPGLPACRIFERGATRHALNRVATIKPWRENVFETRFERQMMKKRSGVNRKICKGECNHVR